MGRGLNVGFRDFCHILTLLPPWASVFCKHMSSFFFKKISLIFFSLPDVCSYKYPLSKCYIIYQNTRFQNDTEACRWHGWKIIWYIYLAASRRVIWRPPEEKSYLAAARREELSGGRQKRRVIWRPPEEKSYLAAARREELSGGRQIIIWRRPEDLRGLVKNNWEFLNMKPPFFQCGLFLFKYILVWHWYLI